MRKILKYTTYVMTGALAIIGLGAVAGAVGAGIASAGMPYRQPNIG